MTHLRVENQNSNVEIVNVAIIQKLYNLALNIEQNLEEGESLSDYVSLKGNLQSEHAKQGAYDYLTGNLTGTITKRFPNLTINIPQGGLYIDFADPVIESALMTVYGDGVGICSSDVSTNYLNKSFKNNTSIRTFNELSQFTGITQLINQQFMGASNLTSIDTSKITHVGDNCITDTKITSLNLSSLTNIGGTNAFAGNTLLTSVDFGQNSSLTALKANTFGGCTSLQTITIPTTVTTIPDYCFYNDSNLTTISGTSNVTSIGGSAFENCSKLTTIDISSVTTLTWSSFKGCSKLNNITLNSGLTSIPSSCFNGCSSLTSIDLSNVTMFGQEAFRGCTNLGSGETIEITHTGTSMPYGILYGAKYIGLILHIPNVTSWDNRYPLQHGLSLLQYFDASDCKITSVGSWYSTGGSVITYIVPSSVTSVDYRFVEGLSNLQNLIMLSETPPTISDTSTMLNYYIRNNGRDAIVYVKDSTVRDLYLADSNWGSIPNASTRIKTLAELPVGVWKTGLYQQYEPYLSNSSDPAYATT